MRLQLRHHNFYNSLPAKVLRYFSDALADLFAVLVLDIFLLGMYLCSVFRHKMLFVLLYGYFNFVAIV